MLDKIHAKDNSKNFGFFITANYNFQTKVWDSGGFEISEIHWAKTNPTEPMNPTLNDRLYLCRYDFPWFVTDHWGAVDCEGRLRRIFKVGPTNFKRRFYSFFSWCLFHQMIEISVPKILLFMSFAGRLMALNFNKSITSKIQVTTATHPLYPKLRSNLEL